MTERDELSALHQHTIRVAADALERLRPGVINEIRMLEKSGILGPEGCPEQDFWRWPVVKPDELPEKFRWCYNMWNEIRWYGHSEQVG